MLYQVENCITCPFSKLKGSEYKCKLKNNRLIIDAMNTESWCPICHDILLLTHRNTNIIKNSG